MSADITAESTTESKDTANAQNVTLESLVYTSARDVLFQMPGLDGNDARDFAHEIRDLFIERLES